MEHPYTHLPPKAFWRTGVTGPGPLGIANLWSPRYEIARSHRIVTAGSCFAQHIGRALKARGYGWLDAEPAPAFLPDPARFNYGVFSFRTTNIYTTALLRQWLEWAVNGEPAGIEAWEKDGRWFDPVRPTVEPGGFRSVDALVAARRTTLAAIRAALEADVFVFTLGLTEGWIDAGTGLVYAACPGTAAGDFDPDRHRFVNFGYEEVVRDLNAAIALARSVNPGLRFLLTVSPVPLAATAEADAHVLVATTWSKSVLRAAAGHLAETDGVDYFPSYEIVTAPVFRGLLTADNLRDVTPQGVACVMDGFFREMTAKFGGGDAAGPPVPRAEAADDENEIVCEEMMLEDFDRA